ncbi:MAG: ParB/Srx family N-terminal domain-containing protein [Bdellovibrionota bacterium]
MFFTALLIGSLLSSVTLADDFKKIKITEAHPTQFSVGMLEVDLRRETIRKAISENSLKKLLKKNRGTGVYGPPGKSIYLVDGHHFARALFEEGIEEMQVEIVKDWTDHSEKRFWKKMKKNDWVYLKDSEGIKRSPKELPIKINLLEDDPYRGLAYLVREAGGFENLKIPFQEFAWADFFREKVKHFDTKNPKSVETALNEALALCRDPEAKKLPGYLGKLATSNCVLNLLLKRLRD